MISTKLLLLLLAFRASDAAQAPNDINCPQDIPNDYTCNPETLADTVKCKYNFFSCNPQSANTIALNTCHCTKDGMFICLSVTPCAATAITSFPSAAPSPEEPWVWEKPVWWAKLRIENGINNLRKCKQLENAPATGSRCGAKRKDCYWGFQDCHDGGEQFPFPNEKCVCDFDFSPNQENSGGKRVWDCKPEPCPSNFEE